MQGFQVRRDGNSIVAVFTGGKEYRKMLWLFPEDEYRVFNFNGYPAVRLLAWSRDSFVDAMKHG